MQETLSREFSIRLKQLRKKNKWTQQELAGKIQVTKETLYRYEKNLLPPSYDSVVRLAVLFGVSVDYLMGWTDSPVSEEMHKQERIYQGIQALDEAQRKSVMDTLKKWIYEEVSANA